MKTNNPVPSISAASAFTLVEIVSCLLLFSMGLMAVVGIFSFGLKSANAAQADATAWGTAISILKDPMPQGATYNATTGRLTPWTWTATGNTWNATDDSGQTTWEYTSWTTSSAVDVTVPDMASPLSNSASFPAGSSPATGCARGWINGYYVERREQSLASERLDANLRLVEVRVDVYMASYNAGDGRPLASAVDRVIRNGGL